MLSAEEKIRYSRHTLLKEIGEEGQEKLKATAVLVVGAGGLGCPVLQYLAAAGIGRIGIIDFDRVDTSNLQRQILYTVDDVGHNKAQAAKKRLAGLNPLIKIEDYNCKLTPGNALSLFKKYDIIVDGTDNFSTRYLTNDAAVITEKPLVYGSIFKFEGQVSVFNYKNGPSYRCLFPTAPEPGSVPGCSEIGVLGVLPGIIGSMQANEVIKIVLGRGTVLSGKLCIYNTLHNRYSTLSFDRNENEISKVLQRKQHFSTYDYEEFCGLKTNENMMKEINAGKLSEWISQRADIQIIDVRESFEQPKITAPQVVNIPMGELHQRYEEIHRDKDVVVFCQHGVRSIQATMMLQEQYDFNNLLNLKGGIVTMASHTQSQ